MTELMTQIPAAQEGLYDKLVADAGRWAYARQFISVEDVDAWIESLRKGHVPAEDESRKADEAVDSARFGAPPVEVPVVRPVILGLGDVVTFSEASIERGTLIPIPRPQEGEYSSGNDNYIITAVTADRGVASYSVNGCSWYSDEDLVFVNRATKETLEYVIQVESGSDDLDEEEQEEDDSEFDECW